MLVNAPDGAWVVSADGSKRFLNDYRDAAWSPHRLYLAAVRGNQLVAMEPNGKVHWKLARRGAVHDPQWSYEGFRIGYFAGRELRVVNGDGTGDRLLTPDARRGVLAWQPDTHTLAFVNRAGSIVVRDVDLPRSVAVTERNGASTVIVNRRTLFSGAGTISGVAWSPDSRWLLLNWTGADQWVFLRTPVSKLVAVSNIRGNLSAQTTLAGWCCP